MNAALAIARPENKITIALALRGQITGQKESLRPGRIEAKRSRAGNGPLTLRNRSSERAVTNRAGADAISAKDSKASAMDSAPERLPEASRPLFGTALIAALNPPSLFLSLTR